MFGSGNAGEQTASPQGVFATTHWSVVLAAGHAESDQANEALEKLCRTYWYPLYVHVRRRGHSVEDAQDLTQQLFAWFLEKDYFRLADRARGRFRTFLLHALEHFLVNEWKRAHRIKRGAGSPDLSLDAEAAERRYAQEPATWVTPERAYEKRWAMTLLEQVLAGLRQEYVEAGHGDVFDELGELLWGKDAASSYATIGEHLGMTEGATRTAMHRLRERYRARLRTEVAHTVACAEEVEEELRYLIVVISQQD